MSDAEEELEKYWYNRWVDEKKKVENAKKILRGHCSGYYHCQKNCYDELKEALE